MADQYFIKRGDKVNGPFTAGIIRSDLVDGLFAL